MIVDRLAFFLSSDNDWVRFFIRVTYLGQELITAEKRAKIDNNPHLLRFFQWIFMRNPLMRYVPPHTSPRPGPARPTTHTHTHTHTHATMDSQPWLFVARNATPHARPTLEDVIVKFQEMLNVMMPQLQESASMILSPINSSNFTAPADPRASMSTSSPTVCVCGGVRVRVRVRWLTMNGESRHEWSDDLQQQQ
jgi:hypothetical protein